MGHLEGLAAFADQADTLVCFEDLQPGEGYPYAKLIRSVYAVPEQTAAALAAYLVNATRLCYGDAARRRNFTQIAVRMHPSGRSPHHFSISAALDVSNEASFASLQTSLGQA